MSYVFLRVLRHKIVQVQIREFTEAFDLRRLAACVQRSLIYSVRAFPHGTSTRPKSAPQTPPECQYGCTVAVTF